jgi:hypothetical protein
MIRLYVGLFHDIIRVSIFLYVSVLLARLRFDQTRDVLPSEISVGAIECYFPGNEEQGNAKVLEVDFFDDENLVLICQSQKPGSECLRWSSHFFRHT